MEAGILATLAGVFTGKAFHDSDSVSGDPQALPHIETESQKVCIRTVDADSHRQSATILIDRMYSRRGYHLPHDLNEHPQRISLLASRESTTVGTLTLGLDSPDGLQVDEVYRDQVDSYRQQGRSVCELTKLALDATSEAKRMLASLFHLAYIYGRLFNDVTDVLIEVNPRHSRFYQRMLGFRQIGGQRHCTRVNAPAVLLGLDLTYVDQQIALFGGRPETASCTRSLYPYFFSKADEEGIARRIQHSPVVSSSSAVQLGSSDNQNFSENFTNTFFHRSGSSVENSVDRCEAKV